MVNNSWARVLKRASAVSLADQHRFTFQHWLSEELTEAIHRPKTQQKKPEQQHGPGQRETSYYIMEYLAKVKT